MVYGLGFFYWLSLMFGFVVMCGWFQLFCDVAVLYQPCNSHNSF